MTTIRTTVNGGLPCIALLTYYTPLVHATWEEEESGGEVEFDLQTLKGKPAPWIFNAATQADIERIAEELIIRIKEMKHDRSY